MKRAIFLVVVLLMVLTAMPAAADNGAPNGPHYNLNLIGVKEDSNKTGDFDSGGRIFIPLWGKADINLQCSDCTEDGPGGYAVVDGNGLDANGASFMLPNPEPPAGSTKFAYSVWIRPVAAAKKDATISLTSCVNDVNDVTHLTETWCYVGNAIALPKSSQFKDVTSALLQVCALQADGSFKMVPLFDDEYADYFWHVDNDGMRNTQMRFYEVQTTEYTYSACTPGTHPPHDAQTGAASVLQR